jgi:hypothetical protein
MNIDERNESSSAYSSFKTTMHIGMGVFYLIISFLLFYANAFGAMELPTGMAYALGTLMLAYGVFRIWRGVMDLRLKKRNRQ